MPSGPSHRWQNRGFVGVSVDAHVVSILTFILYLSLSKSLLPLIGTHLLREWGPQLLLAHPVQTAVQTFRNPPLTVDSPSRPQTAQAGSNGQRGNMSNLQRKAKEMDYRVKIPLQSEICGCPQPRGAETAVRGGLALARTLRRLQSPVACPHPLESSQSHQQWRRPRIMPLNVQRPE